MWRSYVEISLSAICTDLEEERYDSSVVLENGASSDDNK